MKTGLGQIYIKPGVAFPFSPHFQVWISAELESLTTNSALFKKKFGAGYNLVFNLSADTSIAGVVVKGPTVFKRTKDVEYSIFLPFDTIARAPKDSLRLAFGFLLEGIRQVFVLAGLDVARLEGESSRILEHLLSDSSMLDEPWPFA